MPKGAREAVPRYLLMGFIMDSLAVERSQLASREAPYTYIFGHAYKR
jgi:hypothetical protein